MYLLINFKQDGSVCKIFKPGIGTLIKINLLGTVLFGVRILTVCSSLWMIFSIVSTEANC